MTINCQISDWVQERVYIKTLTVLECIGLTCNVLEFVYMHGLISTRDKHSDITFWWIIVMRRIR